ncbi:MAG: hypothetical protein P1U67_11030 [Alcanivoracaceae bacterium]|nr:hypothetical protein [Alcanivoracaceae bacterium]
MSGRLFGYAASPALLAMAVLAGALSSTLFIFALFFNVVLVRYGLTVIEHLSRGEWQRPSLSDAMTGDISLFIKQVLILIVMYAVPIGLVAISPLLGYSLFFLALLGTPASIMTLALTESMISALNPAYWLKLMWVIGWPYLVLWFALTSVTSAPGLITTFVADGAAASALDFISGTLTFYCGVVGFAMMGYLLYEHADKLGIGGTGPRGKDLAPAEYERREALGLSHIYAQIGRIDDATKVVERALHSGSADAALHERKFMLLKLNPQSERFIGYTDEYLRFLVAGGRVEMAVSAYLDVRQTNPKYKPSSPDIRMALARGLAARQKWREAKVLLVNLHSQHPDFEGLGDAYLLLARVYLEYSDSAEKAGKVLGFLQKNFSELLGSDEGIEVMSLYRRLK